MVEQVQPHDINRDPDHVPCAGTCGRILDPYRENVIPELMSRRLWCAACWAERFEREEVEV